jgi:cell division protein FtsB
MRWYIIALAALVLMLQYRIWISPDGTREVMQLSERVQEQTTENKRLVVRNQQLAAEVRNLKQDFQALEERARAELGLISANETYYQVVPASGPHAAEPAVPADPLRAAAH